MLISYGIKGVFDNTDNKHLKNVVNRYTTEKCKQLCGINTFVILTSNVNVYFVLSVTFGDCRASV